MSSKNVQILHSAQGRGRLHLSTLKHDHKESHSVHRRLCSIEVVDSVENNPQTGIVNIDYDAGRNASLLIQLSGAQALNLSPLEFDREELEKFSNGTGKPPWKLRRKAIRSPSIFPWFFWMSCS